MIKHRYLGYGNVVRDRRPVTITAWPNLNFKNGININILIFINYKMSESGDAGAVPRYSFTLS
jgi:hypothetical protein